MSQNLHEIQAIESILQDLRVDARDATDFMVMNKYLKNIEHFEKELKYLKEKGHLTPKYD